MLVVNLKKQVDGVVAKSQFDVDKNGVIRTSILRTVYGGLKQGKRFTSFTGTMNSQFEVEEQQ